MNAMLKAAAVLGFGLVFAPLVAAAQSQGQAPPVPLYRAFDSGAKSTDRGTIEGTVV